MGIILLLVSLTAFLLIMKTLVWAIEYKKSHYSRTGFWEEDIFQYVLTIAFFLSLIVLFIASIVLGIMRADDKDEYNQLVYQKEVLEYRLDNEELAGNELLWKDITDFNNEIRSKKYWLNNPWTSWYNNPLISEIDYIEIIDNETNKNEE